MALVPPSVKPLKPGNAIVKESNNFVLKKPPSAADRAREANANKGFPSEEDTEHIKQMQKLDEEYNNRLIEIAENILKVMKEYSVLRKEVLDIVKMVGNLLEVPVHEALIKDVLDLKNIKK